MKANCPPITESIMPKHLKACWSEIRQIIMDTLPQNDELLRLMIAAGAPTTAAEIDVSEELCKLGLKYSSFMRYRLTLLRLRPMLGI